MALGALGELRRRGLDVPGQVAVAGFGGVVAAADANPTLTTIALPLSEMAGQAAAWVLEGIAPARQAAHYGEAEEVPGEDTTSGGDAGSPHEVRVRGDVELRESTALASQA